MVDHLVAAGEVPDGYILARGCLIHRDSSIARDATLVGPVMVGPGARIGSRAVVVGPTSIGRDVEVGQGALLSRSAVWRRCIVGDYAVADRCILADDTVVVPGASVFRAVIMPTQGGETADFETSAGHAAHNSAETWRPARRGVPANAVWSRSPAAQ
jgi:NDP-sugar pyrophosphorylase family protein